MHALPTSQILARVVRALAFVCLLTVTANAFTVVMHGGRRVEIPARFVVTVSSLTYEISPGVQITLNLAAIDVSATEKANNEVAGSLLRRVQTNQMESRPAVEEVESSHRAGRLTITNRDLESSMRRRRESELAYERRRLELGLPSMEESRRQAAAESDKIARELEQTRASERDAESYWRERAAALRTEVAAVDAQLLDVRRQLDEPTFPPADETFLTSFGVVSFRPRECFGSVSARWPVQSRPDVFVAPHSGARVTGRVAFGQSITRGQVFQNPWGSLGSRRFGSPLLALPNVTAFGSSLPPYGIAAVRNQLITEFNQLSAVRAGLNARWRELEDEARRAGAPPGWLRP